MLTRTLAVAVVAVGTVIVGASTAAADGAGSAVQCQQSSAPGCTVTAGTSGAMPAPTSSVQPQAGVSGGGSCTDYRGKPAPCTDATFGWMGSNGCYWQVDTDYKPPAWNTADQHTGESGAWFVFTCSTGNFPGTGGGIVWLPTSGGPIPLPPPVALARQAVNQLRLVGPDIATSPPVDGDQLVNVSTWLWLARERWAPMSATASVPGESVTATATPTTVTWELGDGTTIVCHGPGTPYASGDPSAPSPDCGHTYLRSSAGMPDGAFIVSATVTWEITWAGGGERGSLPALTTTSTVRLRVGESQALNTSRAGV